MRDLYYACNVFFDRTRKRTLRLKKKRRLMKLHFSKLWSTIETRPDMITHEEIKRYIEFGLLVFSWVFRLLTINCSRRLTVNVIQRMLRGLCIFLRTQDSRYCVILCQICRGQRQKWI